MVEALFDGLLSRAVCETEAEVDIKSLFICLLDFFFLHLSLSLQLPYAREYALLLYTPANSFTYNLQSMMAVGKRSERFCQFQSICQEFNLITDGAKKVRFFKSPSAQLLSNRAPPLISFRSK